MQERLVDAGGDVVSRAPVTELGHELDELRSVDAVGRGQVGDAVGVEHGDVARLELDLARADGERIEHAEERARLAERVRAGGGGDDGKRMPGGGRGELPP